MEDGGIEGEINATLELGVMYLFFLFILLILGSGGFCVGVSIFFYWHYFQ